MRTIQFYIFLVAAAVLSAVASCSKSDVIEPGDKNPGQETPDTTEKVDTVVKPEEPAVPEGAFLIQTSFSVDNTPEEGWKTSWTEGDAVNVFSIQGTKPDADESKWTNQGRFEFDSASDNALLGEITGRFFSNENYLWYAVYPYSEGFTDPVGIEQPFDSEEQVLLIGHLPGESVLQKGYGSTAHLSGPNLPVYGAAVTKGKETPQFTMHQMAAVINVRVENLTSAPITVNEVKLEYPHDYLVGRFAVDFSKATIGHGGLNLTRQPVDASKEVALKVDGAEELQSGKTADFYLPVMPNTFIKGSQLLVTVGDYVSVVDITSNMSISSGKMRTFNVAVDEPLDMELTSPASDATIDMSSSERVNFAWSKVDDNDEYTVLFSASENLSKAHKINVTGTSLSLSAQYFDNLVFPLGVEAGETGKIYWAVSLRGDKNTSVANPLNVKRMPKDNEGRVADPLTVKVAILFEDFEIPGTGGKKMHEVCALHAPGGYRINGGGWYDPAKLIKEYEEGLEQSSHGVVNYEVVKTVHADRFFTYFNDQVGRDGTIKEYITLDTLLYLFETRKVDNLTTYDYKGMLKYYGFDKMVDNGEISEVWVYSFPAGGMYESQMIGKDAFWCNSPGLGLREGAPCEKKCIVMGLNYERTADLALHSFGHRFESIMSQVYENDALAGWKYKSKSTVDALTNWEKYSAHSIEYKKFKDGYAHIGCCHFPPNAAGDYDYGNTSYVKTYADIWYDYPDITEDESIVRTVNRNEWNHAGGHQYGFMLWYFGHIPHYKGLCPRDNHLNNWWYYLVDYDNALIYEEQLRNECIKN